MHTVVAYIPALHKGYIDFLKKYSGKLYILDLSLVRKIPRLERDIRAMSAEEIKKSLDSLGICKSIEIITPATAGKIKFEKKVIMPDEDVSKIFAEEYLKGINMEYVPVFLRWDRQISTTEQIIPPGRTISTSELDKELMNLAMKDAPKSSDWWRQIGAVVAKDGKPILIGHNHALPSEQVHNIFGDPRSNFDAGQYFELSKFIHAEAAVIAEAAKKGTSLEGASIYVSTFPCPVCAKSVAAAGIKKVYYNQGYSLLDAEDVLKSFGVEIVKVQM